MAATSRVRGSATVEFALVLPLVLTMALALLQVGLLVKDRLVVEEAARAGARQAAVSGDDGATRQAVIDAGASLDPDGLTVGIERGTEAGSAVTVTVSYEDRVVLPVVSWLFPSTVQLSATVVMRQETG